MDYTFDEDIVSDIHKDIYGRRPSEGWWMNWNASSDAEKQEIWNDLLKDLEREVAEERARQERAVVEFELRVQVVAGIGAGSRETALKWIMEADGVADDNLEELEWCNGLPWGYLRKAVA